MAAWGLERIQKIYIDRAVVGSAIAQRAQSLFSPEKIEIVDAEPHGNSRGILSARSFDRSKTEIYLTEFKGNFFKRCPGARPGLQCCNYFVLNLGLQCNMNCSYCYLQSFINSPVMKIYTNIDRALQELREMGRDLGDSAIRIGTGEVVDSLSLDEISLHSRDLIRFFADYPKWRLEFKTKSDRVDQFLDVPHANNVIVSFSINPENVIASEEHGTASLNERLKAAVKCRARGHIISFHIDPMIYHEGWRESYQSLIDAVTAHFTPEDIPCMSIGALRFQPEQRHLMRERFGFESFVTTAETFPGADGKMRYDQKRREEMFKFVLDGFRAKNPKWNIFLCMETPETWLGAAGNLPRQKPEMAELFDTRPLQIVKRLEANCNQSDKSAKSVGPQTN